MAVTPTGTPVTAGSGGAVSSKTIGITLGSLTSGLLTVSVSTYNNGASGNTCTATYNGNSMTSVVTLSQAAFAGFQRLTVFVLPVGAGNGSAANVVVTFSASTDEAVFILDRYENVDQSSSTGTPSSTSGATSPPTTTLNLTAAVGGMTYAAMCAGASGTQGNVTASQTLRAENVSGFNETDGAAQDANGTGSAVDHTFAGIGITANWLTAGFAINEATGGGGVNVLPGFGQLTLGGFAPTVAVSNNVNVAAGVGSLSLTGFAPFAGTSQSITAGLGQLTLTGFAASVSTGGNISVSPGFGQLTLTGFAPSVATPRNVQAGVGALSLTGFASLVATPQNVQADVGSLTLTGFAATASTPRNVAAGLGTLTLTGFAPTVTATGNVSVLAQLGILTLDGFAPTLSGVTPIIELQTLAARSNYYKRKVPKVYRPDFLDIEFGNIQRAIPSVTLRTVKLADTAVVTDAVLLADATLAPFTITLPDPVRVQGAAFTIKKVDATANAVTVGATIDGTLNPTLTVQYQSISVQSDGTAYWKLASV